MVETVIAMGILMAGFFLFTRLFVYGVRGMDRGEDQAKAVSIATSELARLKDIGRSNRFADLLAEDGRTYPLEGFDVSLEVFSRDTHSPSSELERPHIGTPQARLLEDAVIQATVMVRGEGAESSVTALIGRPRLALSNPPVNIQNVPASLAANDSVTLTANLVARDGSAIPATFDWMVLPGSGNASVEESRNGTEAVFTNQITDAFGATTVAPGTCELQVRTRYFGEEILSAPISVTLNS